MMLIACLPAAMAGALAGTAVYRRLSDVSFRFAVLVLLTISGIRLVAKSVAATMV